jgi:hypothetical protein
LFHDAHDVAHFKIRVEDSRPVPLELRAERLAFTHKALLFRSLLNGAEQMRLSERLRNDVVRTLFERFDCNLDGSMTRNQNHFDILRRSLDALQQVKAIHPGQAKIADQDINALLDNPVKRFLAAIRPHHFVAGTAKDMSHRGPVFIIVFNNQNSRCR